jgi:hypothetical protein
MDIMNYIKPELIVVAIALYFIGSAIKKAEFVKDKYIPLILGCIGIALSGLWVIATSDIAGYKDAILAGFTATVQGVLVAGLSTYVNQLIKQANKEE